MTVKIKKNLIGSHPGLIGSHPGLIGSHPSLIGSHPGLTGSTGFSLANSRAGFCLHPDRSQARVGRVPGRPAGPVRVLKHWVKGLCVASLGNLSPSTYWHVSRSGTCTFIGQSPCSDIKNNLSSSTTLSAVHPFLIQLLISCHVSFSAS